MERMKIDGACHCGAISFEAEIDPRRVVICHCTDCQAMSGAPYRVNVQVKLANFTLRGEPTRYIKTGGSGIAGATHFCPACGAPIYSCRAENPEFANIRLGAVRQRAQLPPQLQGFCDSAMPWAWDVSGVPKADRA
jgi:hypothetical protein